VPHRPRSRIAPAGGRPRGEDLKPLPHPEGPLLAHSPCASVASLATRRRPARCHPSALPCLALSTWKGVDRVTCSQSFIRYQSLAILLSPEPGPIPMIVTREKRTRKRLPKICESRGSQAFLLLRPLCKRRSTTAGSRHLWGGAWPMILPPSSRGHVVAKGLHGA
jgi:hypothetical protein